MEPENTINPLTTPFQEGEAERAVWLLEQEDRVIDSIPYNLVKDNNGDEILTVNIPDTANAKIETAFRLMATAYRLMESAADLLMEKEATLGQG